MAFNVTVADVQKLSGAPPSTYDTQIQFMIDLFTNSLPGLVETKFVSDGAIFQVLNLAGTEIVAGEFIAWLYRQPGYADRVKIGTVELIPFLGKSASDPSGLKAQGQKRLRPYLKFDSSPGAFLADVLQAGGKQGGTE
ncbi:MAG: hypothetical protein K8R88_07480 [Armatimonadetes bacterium]|nr:hypothetical protein [Armatimonadota bacterium]